MMIKPRHPELTIVQDRSGRTVQILFDGKPLPHDVLNSATVDVSGDGLLAVSVSILVRSVKTERDQVMRSV